MYRKSRSSSVDQSRIPILGKKRSTSLSKNEAEEGQRLSMMQPKQSLASASRHLGSACHSASSSRVRGTKDGTKEVRATSDKHYQERAKYDILRWLSERNISDKHLRCFQNPNNSDFKTIVEFMSRCMHLPNNFTLGQKLDESMPDLLSILDYPVTVQKRVFHTVGIPHTWPTLLAILDWMRFIIECDYDGEVLHHVFEGHELSVKGVFGYNVKTYNMFLQGHDDFTDELASLEEIMECDRNIMRTNEQLEAEMLRPQKERVELMEKCSNHRQHLEKLENERNNISGKDQTVTAFNEKKLAIVAAYENEVKNYVTSIQKIDEEMAKFTAEVEAKEEEVRKQAHIGFDVYKLDSDLKSGRKHNNILKVQVEDAKVKKESLQLECSGHSEDLKTLTSELQQSLMNTRCLSQSEEDIVFNLSLAVEADPQFLKSFGDRIEKDVQSRLKEEIRQYNGTLNSHDVDKMKQERRGLEDAINQQKSNGLSLGRDLLNKEKAHARQIMDHQEQLHKQQNLDAVHENELLKIDSQSSALMNEIKELESKREEERQAWQQMMTDVSEMEEKYMGNIQEILKNSNKRLMDDKETISKVIKDLFKK